MKHILAILVLGASLAAMAEKQPFERYQSIIDRHPFGDPPPGFDPSRPPSEVSAKEAAAAEKQLSEEQAQIQRAIHFSMINALPDGQVAVGFSDLSDPKTPVNYYLKVGEKRGGWEVREADPLAATMKIAKGDVEVEMTLGQKGGAAVRRPAAEENEPKAERPRPGSRLFGPRGPRGGGQDMTMAERRRFREQRESEEEKRRQEEEERRKERELKAEEERKVHEAEAAELRQSLMQIKAEIEQKKVEQAAAQEKQAEEEAGGDE